MHITDELQQALVASLYAPPLTHERPVIGPFVVLLDDSSDNPFRNYAAPLRRGAPSRDELSELVTLFRSRDRRPRLEYVEPADALTAALLADGFEIVRRLPLLALGPAGIVDPPGVPGISVTTASEEDLLGAAEVQVAAYGDDEPAVESAQRLVRLVENGGSVVVARSSGGVVGAGLHSAPTAGFAEVAAVAVDEAWRRRGIGAAVAAELTRSVFVKGARPFLQAEGEPEARIYSRIGYQRCGFLALAQLSDPPA